jgi:hypothetical protein
MTKPIATTLACALALPLGLYAAPPADKGKPDKQPVRQEQHQQGHGAADASASGLLIRAGISVGSARQIALGAGLSGAKPLPPGIRKNLARGKPLPPGIARHRMPDGVISQLPSYGGYEWRMAGCDLVLVSTTTQVVADVLIDVFR